MCGIAGFISKDYGKEELVKMTNSLKHRGPDAFGYFFNAKQGIGLGHRRLSIVDLSKKANQPMKSHCKRYIMVYNGEVYNYREIANETGLSNWKTSSDSEVILEAFCKWGCDFVKKLNGMFAIAIYDLLEEKLLLFRDRMGIKPIYFFKDKNTLIFASEIKAINKLLTKKELNYNSIYAYLHLGYIPSDQSIYRDVCKVKPGSYCIIEKNQLKEKIYWEAASSISDKTFTNLNSAKKRLQSLLRSSVEKRLMGDVPIGTFLSGGIDSSIVTAVAQEVKHSCINTFSIGFNIPKYNESSYAIKVANFLKTNHHEFILDENDALSELENIIEHFDEPYADSSALPTMLVSKMAQKHVKICLSGDGGDELFMGYGAYQWTKRINHPIFGNFRYPISKILALSKDIRKKRAALVFNCPSTNWKSHIFSQEQSFFSEKEISQLLVTNVEDKLIEELNATPNLKRELSPSEEQSFFDLNNYLIDDLLVKVDRSSMYSSIEARVPLLDHNIIEFALNISESLKIGKGGGKYILKELLYNYIPQSIMDRPKWGFSIPLEKWLKSELKYLIENYLNEDAIVQTKIFNKDFISNLIKKFYSGENYLYNRLWNIIVLQKFLIKELNF
tara:strand:- start:1633 stop:3480 length:1848 start_codon:yes stop_codon:yes gene_type:complete